MWQNPKQTQFWLEPHLALFFDLLDIFELATAGFQQELFLAGTVSPAWCVSGPEAVRAAMPRFEDEIVHVPVQSFGPHGAVARLRLSFCSLSSAGTQRWCRDSVL